ncbi:hypothetical protein RGU70_00925 [Herbaspirillum sp. RTI4]|uniref:hypothetical protein n=1 Tax=Herbaspirillum sp. RTI4 TaxID=3048640 RepID=UPI002AB39CEC|nr:hypothetical protein [Herbaspirillum sp. RTI4]MDY7576889.1 hypothetical protein [Herbaspirillum sp. RTI4]MEA9982504.1 hypothetical protein [Herbaspirillum sp. RTI4]
MKQEWQQKPERGLAEQPAQEAGAREETGEAGMFFVLPAEEEVVVAEVMAVKVAVAPSILVARAFDFSLAELTHARPSRRD